MQDSESPFDIVFVSAFGRHHWLARELARREWRVAHVDVSNSLGRWSESDTQNPFGFSEIDGLNSEQVTAWKQMVESQKVESGTTLLLDHGPFEGSGPLAPFFKSKVKWDEVTSKKISFQENWLLNLSHQLASSVYAENSKAYQLAKPLPFFSNFEKDCSSSHNRSAAAFFANIKGAVHFESKGLGSLQKVDAHFFQIKFDSQNLKTRVVVWALTSGETRALSKEIFQTLFLQNAPEAVWSWQRFSFRGPQNILARWPIQFYFIEHLRLPWTHDNLVLVSKDSAEKFNVWMRIPTRFRFEKDYLAELARKFTEKLKSRFQSDNFENTALPTETRFSIDELGAPRWPVYLSEDLKKRKVLKASNLIFESCEDLGTHQAQASMEFQIKLLPQLEEMRKQWLLIEAKLEQKRINREMSMRK